MGKIYYVMGKSAAGKNTVYDALYAECEGMRKLISYTTRPKRDDELDGRDYHFVDKEAIDTYKAESRLVELRTYHTIHGDWIYATIDDGSVDLRSYNYIGIGTLDSYIKLKGYYSEKNVYPIYIEIDDGLRLERALKRERLQKYPRYKELCRRFLADEEDFALEKLRAAGIVKSYDNTDFKSCIEAIKKDMLT